MPATLSYPGVYIEEIPSGVRTITGVATSVTAFVGRASRGPVEEPVTINSFGDFERIFGGLWTESALGFSVRDFYLNGGSQAIVVRLNNGGTAAALNLATGVAGALPPDDFLKVVAASAGKWGNNLSGTVDYNTKNISDNKLFNLTIIDAATGVVEKFLNVSIDSTAPRFVGSVLDESSTLVRGTRNTTGSFVVPSTRPSASTTVTSASGGTDGSVLGSGQFTGSEAAKTGIFALAKADLFNILCIPPYKADGNVDSTVVDAAIPYCEKRRAFLLVDSPTTWTDKSAAIGGIASFTKSKNAALFFPRLREANPLHDSQLEDFAPSGAIAGIFARTDSQRGVWKAPAGLDAMLVGVPQLSVSLTDGENGELNPLGINCLRAMPAAGRVVWGSRTLQGDDRLASEWKYIPVRRTALFLEESLYRGTQWVVFEPNDEPLWAQIRLKSGAFMHNLFRQGAFQGKTPKEAYFVKCDKETTTQNDINLGVVNILVGFAPLKPAEFVVIKLQQMAGQIET
jgi:phage tail sheath protein FI